MAVSKSLEFICILFNVKKAVTPVCLFVAAMKHFMNSIKLTLEMVMWSNFFIYTHLAVLYGKLQNALFC